MDGYELYMLEIKGIQFEPAWLIQARQDRLSLQTKLEYELSAELPYGLSFPQYLIYREIKSPRDIKINYKNLFERIVSRFRIK